MSLVRFWKTHISSPSPDYLRPRGATIAAAGAAAGLGVAAVDSFVPALGPIPADKMKHATVTFGLTVGANLVLGLPPWLAAASSFMVGTVGKEIIWDGLLGQGTPDALDGVANAAGAVAGWGVCKAVEGGRRFVNNSAMDPGLATP